MAGEEEEVSGDMEVVAVPEPGQCAGVSDCVDIVTVISLSVTPTARDPYQYLS